MKRRQKGVSIAGSFEEMGKVVEKVSRCIIQGWGKLAAEVINS
jgi:hypothetical protein